MKSNVHKMVNRANFNYLRTFFIAIIGVMLVIKAEESHFDPLRKTGNTSDIHFLLWTRSNLGDEEYFILEFGNLSNLKNSPFKDKLKTYFIFHGYTSNGTDRFILQGKSNLLSIEDCNYISVDYYALIPGPNYNEAASNIYVTGIYTASFIDWLVEATALETTRIQLVGFSFGAHTAGMTGYHTTSGKIDRITGLDPAGRLWYDAAADMRLDKSQATFVDVIHTNGGKIALDQVGLLKPVGHIDFYPNGGQRQPGCPATDGCDHRRASDYWAESILAGYPSGTNKSFVSWPCKDWDTFQQEECISCGLEGCLEMGFHLNKRFNGSNLYFLRTSSSPHYALGDVQKQ